MPRTALRSFVTGLTAVGVLLVGAGAASAHVTVTPTSVPAGQDATLTFQVPDEQDDASTVSLQLVLADGAALHEVSVLSKPGWTFSTAPGLGTATNSPEPAVPTATASSAPQATPMANMPGMSGMSGMSVPGVARADVSTPSPSASAGSASDSDGGGPAIGSITWTARDSAAVIRPGTFQQFAISAAMPADRSSLIFAAIQTYSDGTVVRWIDRAAPGAAEPAHPAPTVTLGSAGAMAAMPGMNMSDPTSAPKSGAAMSTAMSGMSGMSGMDMSGTKSDSVNVALAVAIAALIAAMTAAVLAMNTMNRARRSTNDH